MTDQPVGLAGLAVGAGEEDPQQVAHDRGQEHVRRPVVDLPHEQAAAHVEADCSVDWYASLIRTPFSLVYDPW